MGMYGKMTAVEASDVATMATMDFETMLDVLEGDGSVDLDKAWDVTFRLIESISAPQSFFDSAEPVGEELVYGPAMHLSPSVVAAIATSLAGADAASVEAAYASLDFDEMYPGIEWSDPDESEFALDAFREAVALFERAAVHGKAIVFAIV
jgi:hypothetical protein